MLAFLIALAGFVAIHVGVSATGLRAVLVERMGEWPYRGAFSVLSVALLAAVVVTYGWAIDDPANDLLYRPPVELRPASLVVTGLGVALAVGGLLSPGPTLAGFETSLLKAEPARGFLRITRHPFLWGVALWGVGHLMTNGRLASVALFAGLAVMVLLGTRSIDAKTAARNAEAWGRFKDATSNVPFAAIVQGRNRPALSETWWRAAVGLAAAAGVAWLHGAAFGRAVL